MKDEGTMTEAAYPRDLKGHGRHAPHARWPGNARVALQFVPLDDPDVQPTTLALRAAGHGDYAGAGPNLAFDGRWRVDVFFALLAFGMAWLLWIDAPRRGLGWLVIIGTLPIAILGILFQDQIDHAFRDLRLIAFTLIFFGILLGVADLIGYRFRTLDDHLTVPHGIWFGLAQALALIPGVSRSGGTITAGRLLGYKREEAAEYAFLLAVPAVFASGFYKLADIGGSDSPPWGPTIAATIVAFVVGYVVITWLMAFIKKRSFMPFVVYRLALGALILVLVGTGALDPNAGPTP